LTLTAKEKNDARLARAILRVVQNTPGIRRTFLTTQVRAYGDNAFDVLDELIARGLIVETPKIIRVKSKNRRAALTYRLAEGFDFPEFDDIDYVAAEQWLAALETQQSKGEVTAVATA